MIENHLLKHFSRTSECFSILGGRLYTVSRKAKEECLVIGGKAYGLEESEKISFFEGLMLEQNKDMLEERISRVLSRKRGSRGAGKSAGMQGVDAERFIEDDLFKCYFNKKAIEENSNPGMNNNSEKAIDVKDLLAKRVVLDELIGRTGIVRIGQYCYRPVSNAEGEDYLLFRGRRNGLRRYKTIGALSKEYSKKIEDGISRGLREIGNMSSQGSKRQDDRRDKGKGQCRNLSYHRIAQGEYEVRDRIDPFIIKKDIDGKTGYYAFGETEIKLLLHFKGDSVRIADPPCIPKERAPYKHPFVYMDGRICFGDYDWKDTGVSFHKSYSLENKNTMADCIARVLKRARGFIERGYIGKEISPVHSLSNCDCLVAEKEIDALAYVKEKGIDPRRIIENP